MDGAKVERGYINSRFRPDSFRAVPNRRGE